MNERLVKIAESSLRFAPDEFPQLPTQSIGSMLSPFRAFARRGIIFQMERTVVCRSPPLQSERYSFIITVVAVVIFMLCQFVTQGNYWNSFTLLSQVESSWYNCAPSALSRHLCRPRYFWLTPLCLIFQLFVSTVVLCTNGTRDSTSPCCVVVFTVNRVVFGRYLLLPFKENAGILASLYCGHTHAYTSELSR